MIKKKIFSNFLIISSICLILLVLSWSTIDDYLTNFEIIEYIKDNYDSEIEITIESDSGTQFYYDIGTPSLLTKVNGYERIGNDYTYV